MYVSVFTSGHGTKNKINKRTADCSVSWIENENNSGNLVNSNLHDVIFVIDINMLNAAQYQFYHRTIYYNI